MALAVPTTSSDFTVATSGSASSITGNKPTDLANGDLLVACVSYRNSGTTFTPPSGWTLISSQTTGQSEAVYYKYVATASGEPATYTWSFTGGVGRCSVQIFRITGAPSSGQLDATGTWEAGPISTMVFPAVTAVAANTMLIAFGLALTTTTSHPVFTAPSGMTTLTQSQWDNGSASSSAWIGFQALTATGSTGTRTASLSPSANSGNGIMFTIAPASTFTAPTANAGSAQTVPAWSTVTLDGSGSTDPNSGGTLSYAWTQTAGAAVSLSSSTAQKPTFTAPPSLSSQSLTFSLVVTDSASGLSSSPSTVTITIEQVTNAYLSGSTWTPMRVVGL